jgi:hypothetical protein
MSAYPSLVKIAAIAAVAYCLRGIGSVVVKGIFKAKIRSLAEKKAQSKNEVEKKKLEVIESSMNAAIEGMKAVSTAIVQANSNSVDING